MTLTYDQNTEALRKALLEEVYGGASAGLGAMLLDEHEIRQADARELEKIARRYGMREERHEIL